VKIIFAGWHNPNFESITEYSEKALMELGHEVFSFEYRQYIVPGILRDKFPFINKLDNDRINAKLINTVKRLRPDLVFVLQGANILPGTIDHIRKFCKVPCVNWFIDYPPNFDIAQKVFKHYDHFFVSTSYAMIKHRELGNTTVRTLDVACDPQVHTKLALSDKDVRKYGNDVVFVGSYYPERESALSSLDGFDVGIWGPSWEKLSTSQTLKGFIKGGQTTPEEWVKIYNASKIVLNINYGFGRLPELDCNPGSTKLFEIPACGAFELVDNKKAITDQFEDGRHLVTFSDTTDLKQKIRYYLDHAQERECIAANGRKEVLAKHTYKDRMREMLSVVFPSVS
jgi:spore maturation protein CgeB